MGQLVHARSRCSPMLDQYTSQCMVSIVNIDNGIKEPTGGYCNCNTNQILIFGGYVKVRNFLYTQIIIFGSIPI